MPKVMSTQKASDIRPNSDKTGDLQAILRQYRPSILKPILNVTSQLGDACRLLFGKVGQVVRVVLFAEQERDVGSLLLR